MTIAELKYRKKVLGYTNEQVAELSGVPLGTVVKIFSGVTKSPRYQTMQALEKVLFQSGSKESYEDLCGRKDSCAGMLREEAAAYAYAGPLLKEKKYTVDDYHAFKDDIRRELIDGRLFIMDSPTVLHQVIIGELYAIFRECAALHGDTCRVLLSPRDVQLDQDRYTMVQPDLMVICDNEKVRSHIFGAPDLVAEIMSPSSRSRDSVLKLNKYMKAGIREFWLIDPENKTVIVYLANGNGEGVHSFQLYTFHDIIPVGLSGGECKVDFRIVARAVEGLEQ